MTELVGRRVAASRCIGRERHLSALALCNGRCAHRLCMSPSKAPETDVDIESDSHVVQLGDCASLYTRLEECLAENDRDWRRCQFLVKALKVCQLQQNLGEKRS